MTACGGRLFSRVDRLAQMLAVGPEILAASGEPLAMDLAAVLATYRAGDDNVTFEDAAGVGRDWRSFDRARRRDETVQRIAGHFPGLAGRKLAREVDRAISHYQGTSWRRDRDSGRRPDGLDGDVYDLLARGAPPGFESIRKIMQISGYSERFEIPNAADTLIPKGNR